MASSLVAPEGRLLGRERESELSDSEEILLRTFRPDGEDEQQMRELVFDNAFLGKPFDVICPCKRWFSDVVLTPYIKHQPENIQVAVHQPSGHLVGYLTGSLRGQEFESLQYKLVKKKVLSLALSLTMPWSFFDLSSRLGGVGAMVVNSRRWKANLVAKYPAMRIEHIRPLS